MLLIKFLTQFFRHKTSISILVISLLLSQIFIYLFYLYDPIKADSNSVLTIPLGMVFLPSIIIIFLLGPLFLKYSANFPYLRNQLFYNENFLSNLKIILVKISYFYTLAFITMFLNWIITYSFYFNNLGAKAFFGFLGLAAFALFFVTNLMILTHKFNLGFKINIALFVLIMISFFIFYSPSTILAYYLQNWPNSEMTDWFSVQKAFLPFYYVLLNFDTKNTIANVDIILGDLNKQLIILLSVCSSGIGLFLINLVSNNLLMNFSKKASCLIFKK